MEENLRGSLNILVFNTIHCKNLKPEGKRPICALVSIYFQRFAILFHFWGAPAPY